MYPSGNQPPYNNPPQYTAPQGNYVPQGQQRGGGCWMWGGLGCLLVFIIFAAIAGISAYKIAKSPAGKSFMGGMGAVTTSASKMAGNAEKAKIVEDALKRYKADNGHYPATLSDLIPKYMPDASALHLSTDTNPDPSHISFVYKQPAKGAPGNTPLLSYNSPMDMSIMGMQDKVNYKMTDNVDGSKSMDTTQTMTSPDGRTSTTTQHTDISSGKTTTTASTSGAGTGSYNPFAAPSPISP